MGTPHPYRRLPPQRFWRNAEREAAAGELDPVTSPPFRIGPGDAVATAGSCFAQHIAAHLRAGGFNLLVTETSAEAVEAPFSALYGNIYTARQMLQLVRRALGLWRPKENAWRRPDGRWVDPFRPQLFPAGFDSPQAVHEARLAHLAAVARLLTEARVLVLTLGLTEAWLAPCGAALPVPPGVLGIEEGAGEARFHNFTFEEVAADLAALMEELGEDNPGLRVILTVSPVPLVATYEARHVLESNTLSKAVLRAAADRAARDHAAITYFPSFEMVTSHLAPSDAFAPDRRSVSEAMVGRVMALFGRHFLADASGLAPVLNVPPPPPDITPEQEAAYRARTGILCDEERLDPE
ncbi:GSCFA domain-containing protein [Rhodovarius lipocyclicus]|uniref:GSCFA domain-containing protein n=1 Tax=Rhodovarius lipocyclicus TaxID=268410 RepID=UPI001F3090D7|nr:GSCFA domain-containing protein [Rhodovarius lipocyclicus]